jgi:transcriptional regulator with XRE-family HTH domain
MVYYMVKNIPLGSIRITGIHIRAARAILRWSAEELAKRTKLGITTIRRAEAADGPVPLTVANAETIIRTLEAAGIDLINGDAPGVRLKKKR